MWPALVSFTIPNLILSIASILLNINAEIPENITEQSQDTKPDPEPSHLHEHAAELLNEPAIEQGGIFLKPKLNRAVFIAAFLSLPNLILPFFGAVFFMPPLVQQTMVTTCVILINLVRVPILYHGIIKGSVVQIPEDKTSNEDRYIAHMSRRENDTVVSSPVDTELY